MQEQRFWLLISLKLSDEATPEELAELDQLLQQDPALKSKADMLAGIWTERNQGRYGKKEDQFNKHLQRLSNHLSEPVLKYETRPDDLSAGNATSDFPGINTAQAKKQMPPEELTEQPESKAALEIKTRLRQKRLLWIMGGIAASLLFAVVYFKPEAEKKKTGHLPAQNTVSTKPGSKTKIQLPDGSQAWLNADSKLIYNENFIGTTREVQLNGEAYFDIAPAVSARTGQRIPFIIHTPTIDLRVLGTAFNIRSYANEKNTETALIHGSVEITLRNNPDKKIILKPNEKLLVRNNEFSVSSGETQTGSDNEDDQPMMTLSKIHFQKSDSSATEILWTKNKLVFDGENLEDIALKIERWYDVKVTITDSRLKQNTYSGVFEDESLQQVMEALRITGNFRYTINKKEVIIKR